MLSCYIYSPKMSSEAETPVAELSCDRTSPRCQHSPLQGTISWAQALAHWFISDTLSLFAPFIWVSHVWSLLFVFWRCADPDLFINTPVWGWQPHSAGGGLPWPGVEPVKQIRGCCPEKAMDKCTFFPLWVMEKPLLPRKISFLYNLRQIESNHSPA